MLGPRFISPHVAPRGRALSIARPAGRPEKCLHVATAGRDRRDATGKARKTPITRRRLAISGSGDGVSRRPPRAAAAEDSSSSTPTPPPSSSSSPSALVDALLASVAGASADRGSSMTAAERAAADALFDRLARAAEAERGAGAVAEAASSPSSSSSSSSSSSPLDSPFLLGDFDVAYVSTGGKQKGQPAGGRFRSGLGRALFATTAVCQSIFYDDVKEENVKEEKDKTLMVTNKVAFRLAGLLEGSVGLRGKVTAAFPSSDWSRAEKKTAKEGGEKEEVKKEEENDEIADAVRVDFDPAVLSLLPRSRLFRLVLRIGRPSWVALATPYGEFSVFLFFGGWGLTVKSKGLRAKTWARKKT